MVDDGDLNVANQAYPGTYLREGQFSVSKTYNLPDSHNHGGVILWMPFYLYAKSIYSIAAKLNLTSSTIYGLDRLAKCVMSFSTIIFGFIAIVLTCLLCRIFFSGKIALW